MRSTERMFSSGFMANSRPCRPCRAHAGTPAFRPEPSRPPPPRHRLEPQPLRRIRRCPARSNPLAAFVAAEAASQVSSGLQTGSGHAFEVRAIQSSVNLTIRLTSSYGPHSTVESPRRRFRQKEQRPSNTPPTAPSIRPCCPKSKEKTRSTGILDRTPGEPRQQIFQFRLPELTLNSGRYSCLPAPRNYPKNSQKPPQIALKPPPWRVSVSSPVALQFRVKYANSLALPEK